MGHIFFPLVEVTDMGSLIIRNHYEDVYNQWLFMRLFF